MMDAKHARDVRLPREELRAWCRTHTMLEEALQRARALAREMRDFAHAQYRD